MNTNQFAEVGVNSSRDGEILEIIKSDEDRIEAIIQFSVEPVLAERIKETPKEVIFSARSRIARLGINVSPSSDYQEFEPGVFHLATTITPQAYGREVWPIARKFFAHGLPVGRLVDCPSADKLSSVEIFDGYESNQFKVPTGFSIDEGGRILLPSHSLVYNFVRPLRKKEISAILHDPEGKSLLHRLQQPVQVDNVVVRPNEGVITSCSMFLYDHFAVLDTLSMGIGYHLNAIVLDPICTTGTSIFLEVFNNSNEVIVNPTVYAWLYRARRRGQSENNGKTQLATATSSYESIKKFFGFAESATSYSERDIGYSKTESPDKVHWLETRKLVTKPGHKDSEKPLWNRSDSSKLEFATVQLLSLPDDIQFDSLYLRFFPNLREHVDLMQLSRDRGFKRIVFLNASYEHGYYLSARDHSRLADYHDLGIEVFWLNREFSHLAKHVFRGQRGFFCELDKIQDFYSCLLLAVYGSSKQLSDEQNEVVSELIKKLHNFFGRQLGVITGGGPGVMHTVSEIAKRLDMTVGANYLEIEDQKSNRLGDFYQVFQENCRHARQRWFEVSNFHLFLVGGVGTLEEVGVTLTDIKLGIAEQIPIVFFGRGSDGLYWDALWRQLDLMVDEERAPKRILDNILVSDDPEEVISFYKSKMNLG